MTVCTALCPKIELIDVRGYEVTFSYLALKCSQAIALQEEVVNSGFELFFVAIEVDLNVVGISLINLCQQFRGDDANSVMLDRY